jgi:catechol 2,3-dioxygenase-like lactoylglutathione lyase family enzyme
VRVCQTSFTVADLDRSVAFYRDVMGFKLRHIAEPSASANPRVGVITGFPGARIRVAMFDIDGYELELIQYVAPAGKSATPERRDAGAAHIAFRSQDIESDYQRLKARGVRFVSPPQDFGAAKACYFTDPDGITLELLQRNV